MLLEKKWEYSKSEGILLPKEKTTIPKVHTRKDSFKTRQRVGTGTPKLQYTHNNTKSTQKRTKSTKQKQLNNTGVHPEENDEYMTMCRYLHLLSKATIFIKSRGIHQANGLNVAESVELEQSMDNSVDQTFSSREFINTCHTICVTPINLTSNHSKNKQFSVFFIVI